MEVESLELGIKNIKLISHIYTFLGLVLVSIRGHQIIEKIKEHMHMSFMVIAF